MDDALRKVLDRSSMGRKDTALLTELLYGVTRHRLTLDYFIGKFSKRSVDRLDGQVKQILRMGAYQLIFLQRIPPSAAVNEAVKLTKRANRPWASGFVNGVLRSVARGHTAVSFPDLVQHPVTHIVTRYSYPEWLVKRWLDRFGVDATIALCQAGNERPQPTVRVNTLKTTRDDLATWFRQQDLLVHHGRFAPDVLGVSAGRLVDDPRMKAGEYYIQDEGSVLVGHAVAPCHGETIYDLCSAPGGKTTHLAQLMGNQGRILAMDRSVHRLEKVRENATRLGATIVETVQQDARCLPSMAPADRVLVDAPCSGLGTLRHKPDVRWRRTPEDLSGLVQTQRQLLAAAAKVVKPGGQLTYSTCTTEPEENAKNVVWFLNTHPGFRLGQLPDWFPVAAQTDMPGTVQILPHVHAIDGFYIANFDNSS